MLFCSSSEKNFEYSSRIISSGTPTKLVVFPSGFGSEAASFSASNVHRPKLSEAASVHCSPMTAARMSCARGGSSLPVHSAASFKRYIADEAVR